jgi:hypothetical protein
VSKKYKQVDEASHVGVPKMLMDGHFVLAHQNIQLTANLKSLGSNDLSGHDDYHT